MLKALDGATLVRVVPSRAGTGEALVYQGTVENALARTVEQLVADGYTVVSEADGMVTVSKDADVYILRSHAYPTLTMITINLSSAGGAAPAPAEEPPAPAGG